MRNFLLSTLAIVCVFVTTSTTASAYGLFPMKQSIIVAATGNVGNIKNRVIYTLVYQYPDNPDGSRKVNCLSKTGVTSTMSEPNFFSMEVVNTEIPERSSPGLEYLTLWVEGDFSKTLTYAVLYVDDETQPASITMAPGKAYDINCQVLSAWGEPLPDIPVEFEINNVSKSYSTDSLGNLQIVFDESWGEGTFFVYAKNYPYVKNDGTVSWKNGSFSVSLFFQ